MDNNQKCIVLGITGSIAAYKAADICSQLKKAGVSVHVIMTEAASRFISPLTLESLSGHAVADNLFSRETPWEIEHISLAKRADLFLVAPASANFIGKYTAGIADDMLTTTVMATKAPVLIAPAMNTVMYESAANQENMERLTQRGCHFIEPASGMLACGDEGRGKLAPVAEIVEKALELLQQEDKKDFLGKKVLVTAGPTREAIDPVRYISNHSSGKMGYAIAAAAKARGAEVTLVSGPVALDMPKGVERIDVVSTVEMKEATQAAFENCDICIMAAAPADYSVKSYADNKIKKSENGAGLKLDLEETPDILSALAERKKRQFVCGFAAETKDLEHYAKEKLKRKKLDMIAANDVSKKDIGFNADENALILFDAKGGRKELPKANKTAIAHALLDEILKQMSKHKQ